MPVYIMCVMFVQHFEPQGRRFTHFRYYYYVSEMITVRAVWPLCQCHYPLRHEQVSLQSFPLSPLFVRHTHAQNPTLQPQNPWLSHFLTLWPPRLEQSPPRHQALCYPLFIQKPTQDISLFRIFQLNHIVFHSHQSVQCVCACMCASFA